VSVKYLMEWTIFLFIENDVTSMFVCLCVLFFLLQPSNTTAKHDN